MPRACRINGPGPCYCTEIITNLKLFHTADSKARKLDRFGARLGLLNQCIETV
jgi:hypothetical protein